MNREIKFKGWNSIVCRMSDPMTLREIYETKGVQWHIVDWLQYTGLKDKNGVEIYEGDILAYENTLNFKTVLQNHFEIKWEDYGSGMVGFTQFSPRNKFVVCGNIYENPELL